MGPGKPEVNYTISVNVVRSMLKFLDGKGVRTDELLRAHKIERSELDDLEGRLPLEVALRFYEDASLVADEPQLSLKVSLQVDPGTLGAVAYAIRCCATLGDALRRLKTIHPLIMDLGSVELVEEGNRARLMMQMPSPALPVYRHIVEGYLASWLRRARCLTDAAFDPRVVRFRHRQPASIALHQQIFRAPIEFAHTHDEMELDRAVLDLPIRTHDPVLGQVLDRYMEELLQRLPPVNDFVSAVRQFVLGSLKGGEPTLEATASHFRVSGRTLQRRLAENGLSLRQIVDESRRELALRYLSRPEYTISQVGFLLGFDAVTSFHRSFRRWTGLSPAQYRSR